MTAKVKYEKAPARVEPGALECVLDPRLREDDESKSKCHPRIHQFFYFIVTL